MRIKEIKVEGLFDMFDHTITLNMEHHLTIVYGANGVGKTMIFRLLDGIFNFSFDTRKNRTIRQIAEIEFKKISLEFTNGTVAIFSKINHGEIECSIIDKLKKQRKISLIDHEFGELDFDFSEVNKVVDKICKEVGAIYQDKNTILDVNNQTLDIILFLTKYAELIPLDNDHNSRLSAYFYYQEILNSIKLYLIDTERLFSYRKKGDAEYKKDTIDRSSQELAKIIETKNEQYRKLSDDLKNSLSNRILTKQVKTDVDVKTLKQLVKEVEQKRKKYIAVGLIEDNSNNFEIPDDIGELDRAILAVNIQDMLEQLKIYEEDSFYERLQLFIEILNNRRLSYKSIKISEQHGFTFTNAKGKELKPDNLSSGEQHELVLLYQLLFKIPENSLILIDEPEISLHITWQKEFTNDMEDIIKLRNFDILLATHSPSIINGNWEITQSLDGYEEE